jgi:hypothetical protein
MKFVLVTYEPPERVWFYVESPCPQCHTNGFTTLPPGVTSQTCRRCGHRWPTPQQVEHPVPLPDVEINN